MDYSLVFLVCSLTLILGARESVSKSCDQVNTDCFEQAYYTVGRSVFKTIFQGAKEPTCIYRRVFKSCVAEQKECMDHVQIADRIQYLDARDKKINCDNLTLVVRSPESDFCEWRHLVCYRKAKADVDTSVFEKYLAGDKESFCKIGTGFQSCVDENKECLDDDHVAQGFKTILAQAKRKCNGARNPDLDFQSLDIW